MKKIYLLLFFMFFICQIKSLAIDYIPVEINSKIVYSREGNLWSVNEKNKEGIVFQRTISSGTGSYSIYTHGSEILNLKSNFEFIFNSRLIGVDNENFKFYEIVYNNDKFEEKLLSCEHVQEIFSDIDVIKLSDFKKNIYTILGNNEEKNILLYNDTDFYFHKYFVKPEDSVADKNIKAMIKLPKKGKVCITHLGGNDKQFVIKVK